MALNIRKDKSMEKGIVIYQSKYGATKKYVDRLCKITGFDCVETPKADINQVMNYSTVVLCGGIYASGIAGLSFLKKNADNLMGKKLAVFCVGASPYEENAFGQVKAHNLTGKLKDVPLFYGRGAWDEEKMTLPDKALCKLLKKAVEKKDPESWEPWMKALMVAVGQKCDWTDEKYLRPLIEYITPLGSNNRDCQ